MNPQLKNPRFYFMILNDAALFALAHVAAYLLRFEFALSPSDLDLIELVLPYLIGLKLAVFYMFGLYRGMWRYTGMEDAWRLVQASLVSTLLAIAFVLLRYRFAGFPRSVFLLDGLLTFLFSGGLRLAIRSFYSACSTSKGFKTLALPRITIRNRSKGEHRILIIGAGGSGEKLLREIFDNPHLHYQVTGFLDDDLGKYGRTVHGIPVLGIVDELPKVMERYDIEQVFISVPSATGGQMRRIVDICKEAGATYKTLPAIGEIMNGQVSIKALRDVNYEDLLGRPPVSLDTAGIHEYLAGKSVLISGCGGSIGSELCRQVVRFNPSVLILLDVSEANLFQIQMELHHEIRYRSYHCVLGRVQDRPLMEGVFQRHHPQVVFHAAACKHVPMLEINPWEAVFNNVLGSQVFMETAARYEAERFVLVSTDKAVRPSNVMGSSKRLTELILQSLQDSGVLFMAVRFGNVVGSSGSVIPLFRRQIEQGGPVTVTHPEVTRYFMTIPEAAQLILQAGALGRGGEIFVLEMGTPVRIAEMARDLIRLSGKEPGKDIEIVFTGLRAGEKLYEELVVPGEDVDRTKHEKIMVLKSNGDWNGESSLEDFRQWLAQELRELYGIARSYEAGAIKEKLREMVPEYAPQEAERGK